MSSAPYRVDHDRGRYLRGRAQNYIAVFQEGADEQDVALLKNAPALLIALRAAEAALADIGDATREPSDDVAWCEQRAARALPEVRQAIRLTEAA